MNRIEQKFQELKSSKARKPSSLLSLPATLILRRPKNLVVAFEAAGVDIIELGIPFSDPLADGPTIQASFLRALNKGTTVKKILETVRRIRTKSSLPIALMSSYNPIFHFGEEKFVETCTKAGVDALIVPDLPPEEAHNLRRLARQYDIATIFFVAPTSQDERIKANTQASSGFVYYVSLTGITGTQKAVARSVVKQIKHIKRFTNKPVCAGFGISTPQQVKDIGRAADGVIVGSAIVKAIDQNKGNRNQICACGQSLCFFISESPKIIFMRRITQLPNKIRIVTKECKDRDSASIGVWVAAGGRYESKDNKGVAHFLEHMAFKGSAKYSCDETKQLIEGIGGNLNAFTAEEETCYYAKVPAGPSETDL